MRQERIVVEKATEMFIGAPTEPLPAQVLDRLRAALSSMPEVTEAHLPQCFAEGVFDPAGPVLFVVFKHGAAREPCLAAIGSHLTAVLADGDRLDVVPLNSADPMLRAIRGAGCPLISSPAVQKGRPWWRFW